MQQPVSRALILVAAVVCSGCFLFHDDYPDTSCTNDNQCFRAQGEFCDLATRTCVTGPDAAPPADRAASADAAPADPAPAPDAAVADAAGADAS